MIHTTNNGKRRVEERPLLSLRDIYSVIAYYLQNTATAEDYLRQQQEAASQTRREIESRQDTTGFRERLRQRRTVARR